VAWSTRWAVTASLSRTATVATRASCVFLFFLVMPAWSMGGGRLAGRDRARPARAARSVEVPAKRPRAAAGGAT